MEFHGDSGRTMHLFYLTDEQVISVCWRCRQYQRNLVGKQLQLDRLREGNLDIDNIRQQRQWQWDSDLFGFSQHKFESQKCNDYGSREKPHGESGGGILYLFHFTDEQVIYVRWR